MRIALVHELLTMKGGAEKVLRILAEMFPDAPIFTLLYDEKKLGGWFPKERVRTSALQRRAERIGSFNHHLFLRKFPAAVEAWDFSEFDLVISSSSAFAHGIITNGRPKHLCYVHSPARYLWDRTHDVLDRAEEGILGPLKRAYLSHTFHKLRTWDAEAADRSDRLLAASKIVQRRIDLYWKRESTVVMPPIDDFWLQELPSPRLSGVAPAGAESDGGRVARPNVPVRPARPLAGSDGYGRGDGGMYYLVASTLVPYKRIELAIEACNRMKAPLKIAGEGPDRKRLEEMAGPTVAFVGYKNEEELRDLYANARATIFPGDEDFGLVPLESLACGTPVIAFQGGGALETLSEDTTEFFAEPSVEALSGAMERLERTNVDAGLCRKRAAGHSRSVFEEHLKREIETLMR